jgi:hypothetical protein
MKKDSRLEWIQVGDDYITEDKYLQCLEDKSWVYKRDKQQKSENNSEGETVVMRVDFLGEGDCGEFKF